ncbi:SurA N-terminal domain-containing protein [Patescibacteria group bacterium]|nr:SurA N-terminal domain-containing protein [Patescibacteria group bacterium]
MDNEVKNGSEIKETEVINDSVEEVLGKKKKTSIKPIFTGLIVILIVVIIGIVSIASNMFGVKEVSVASVNSESITQLALDSFYTQQEAAYQAQGLDINDPEQLKAAKQQALDNLINQTLLLQAATADGIIITDEDVQSEYDRTVSQFESDEALQTALIENNLTIELLKNNILTQLTIQGYLATRVDENVTVTEEEIQALYDQYVAGGSNIPALEEVKTQLGDQIKQQKLDSQVGAIIEALKDTAEIELYLE